jgi:hypothetical protein
MILAAPFANFVIFLFFIIVLDFCYMDSMSLSWIALISSYAKLFFTVIHEI